VASQEAILQLTVEKNGEKINIGKATIPALKPHEKANVRLVSKPIFEKGTEYAFTSIILSKDKTMETYDFKLLQNHAGEISLLPALPSKYPDGFVKGLKARGGHEVDIYWKNGILEKALIKSASAGKINIRYKDKVKEYNVSPSKILEVN
jgi:hypothetical protein